jgi:pSer/pThr/pTyr-binding forkhead associated (FHA) protein
VLVGSRHSANIRINSKRVSRAHALIIQSQGQVFLRDLNSRTGTTVNGRLIREAELRGGEVVGIGPFQFEFLSGTPLAPLADRRELPAACIEITGGDVLHGDQRITLVGRREGSDVLINDEQVSAAHAAIFDIDGRRFIRDLGSRSGTLVNDRLVSSLEIRLGDMIRIGPAILRYLPAPSQQPDDSGAGLAEDQTTPVHRLSATDGTPATPALAIGRPLDTRLGQPGRHLGSGRPAPVEPPGSHPVIEDVDLEAMFGTSAPPADDDAPAEQVIRSVTDLAGLLTGAPVEPGDSPLPADEDEAVRCEQLVAVAPPEAAVAPTPVATEAPSEPAEELPAETPAPRPAALSPDDMLSFLPSTANIVTTSVDETLPQAEVSISDIVTAPEADHEPPPEPAADATDDGSDVEQPGVESTPVPPPAPPVHRPALQRTTHAAARVPQPPARPPARKDDSRVGNWGPLAAAVMTLPAQHPPQATPNQPGPANADGPQGRVPLLKRARQGLIRFGGGQPK